MNPKRLTRRQIRKLRKNVPDGAVSEFLDRVPRRFVLPGWCYVRTYRKTTVGA